MLQIGSWTAVTVVKDNLKWDAIVPFWFRFQHGAQLTYFSRSSVHCLCGAKQAMAHTLISMPVWNCLFLMSHTPWIGVAIALFCNKFRRVAW